MLNFNKTFKPTKQWNPSSNIYRIALFIEYAKNRCGIDPLFITDQDIYLDYGGIEKFTNLMEANNIYWGIGTKCNELGYYVWGY